MAAYYFGVGFTYTFYPRDTEGTVISASADAPTIYVYEDKPSRDDAQNGTGSGLLETINSWAANGNGYDITVAAITDPEPDGAVHSRTYYLAINFTLAVSGDTLTVINRFDLERPLGYDTELNVTNADIEKFFTGVDGYETDADQTDFIAEAVNWVKAELRNKGYEWAKIKRIDRLRHVVIQRTLYYIALSQVAAGENGFDIMLEESKNEATSQLQALRLEYDSDLDNLKDTTVNYGTFGFIAR